MHILKIQLSQTLQRPQEGRHTSISQQFCQTGGIRPFAQMDWNLQHIQRTFAKILQMAQVIAY